MLSGKRQQLTLQPRTLGPHLAKAGREHNKMSCAQRRRLLHNREHARRRNHDKGQIDYLRQVAERFISALTMYDLAVGINEVDRTGKVEIPQILKRVN